MKISVNSKFLAIATILMLTITALMAGIQTVNAQETMNSFVYCGVHPNKVGVGQDVLLHIGITHPTAWPQTGWTGLKVTVEKPDGSTEELGPYKTDLTGGTGVTYTPQQVGTYTFQTHFPEQELTEEAYGVPAGTVFEAGVSEKKELEVQADPVPSYPDAPLPDSYWTRPINSQHRQWYKIGGNWLAAKGYQSDMSAPGNEYAPETPHVLWAKPLLGTVGGAFGGGVVGGETLGEHSYECGDAYEGYFTPPVIISGVLYFNRYKADGGSSVEQEVVAVDLRTGEELWARPLIGPDGENHRLELGQTYYWSSFNVHGAYAYLWAIDGSTWHAFEASSGRWIYSMENVPARIFYGGLLPNTMFGPDGEIVAYDMNLRDGWIAKWNSEEVVIQQRLNDTDGEPGSDAGSWIPEYMGTTLDGNFGYLWNVTVPKGLPSNLLGYDVFPEDVIVGGNIYKSAKTPENIQLWGLSLAPENRGELLFNRTWTPPPEAEDSTFMLEAASAEDGVFVIVAGESRQHWGFDIHTGEELWGPTEPQNYLDRFTFASAFSWETIYDSKLYSVGLSGIVYCYNVNNGQLLWTYEASDPYAFSEHWQRELGNKYWSTMMLFFADGKLYLSDNEHSPDNPLPRGSPYICLDAETGEEIWRADGLVKGTVWGGQAGIGDSIIATMSTYDNQVFAIGKGPSETTVTASPKVTSQGSSVQIEGTIMDISAGTDDRGVAKRFPKGVPCVADEDMTEWMRHVYLELPGHQDVNGVPVKLTAVDPNGNTVDIGTVTSDSNGMFKKMWTPSVEGEYTVVATFEGSKSYWPSHAQTTLGVEEATGDTQNGNGDTEAADYTLMFVGIIVAVVIAIVIGIVNLYAIRKQK